jgi:hypothetical protein
VPGEKQPSQAELSGINDVLEASLRSCRSVVANYKSLLEGDAAIPFANDDMPTHPKAGGADAERD